MYRLNSSALGLLELGGVISNERKKKIQQKYDLITADKSTQKINSEAVTGWDKSATGQTGKNTWKQSTWVHQVH